jgi:Protein of unknown function with HXXEE motif
MSDSARSMILGPSVLYGVAAVALVLTIVRRPAKNSDAAIDAIIRLYLIGIAFQCLHFAEECVTRFYVRAPEFLGFVAWPSEFFVIFNLTWIAVWLLAAVGVKCEMRVAYFPLWFFAVGMVGNAVWHPLLCVATGGYFPGLFTSPFAGIVGVLLLSRLRRLTERAAAPIQRDQNGGLIEYSAENNIAGLSASRCGNARTCRGKPPEPTFQA